MEEKRTSAMPILVALLLVAVPLSAYAGGYFLRGSPMARSFCGMGPPSHVRYFKTPWEAKLFEPAARVESLVTGKSVSSTGPMVLVDEDFLSESNLDLGME